MNGRQQPNLPPPEAGFSQRDVFYILFRHKWMVMIFTVLGLVASVAIYKYFPFPYVSQAMVYIGYMPLPNQPADELTGASKVISPDDRGADILNTEMTIMSSHNLALDAARAMGPPRILGNVPQSNSVDAAADFISAHMTNFVPKACDVITVQFRANNPGIVQPVLSNLLVAYSNMYVATHLTKSLPEDFLLTQTLDARTQLADAAGRLRDKMSSMGIISLDDTKKDHTDMLARMTMELNDKMQDYASVSATVADLEQRLSFYLTNAPKASAGATNAPADLALMTPSAPPAPPPDVQASYQSLVDLLKARRFAEESLKAQLTTNALSVQTAQKRREQAEADVKKMEEQYPALLQTSAKNAEAARTPSYVAQAAPIVDPVAACREALNEAMTNQNGLSAKIRVLTNSIAQEHAYTTNLMAAEPDIVQYQVDKTNALDVYRRLVLATTEANAEEAVGPGRVSNIKVVEAPTSPARDGKKILKATGVTLFFFLALAFGLPFFIEMVLDQSLKSPLEVQARINQPFFLTIPKTNGAATAAALRQGRPVPLLANGSESHTAEAGRETSPAPDNGRLGAWNQRQELQPFFETLRDRLMTYFEVNNLTHKPKLVAVTSCGHGAGVTTTAAGLASSLSETGEGNVLLVNMSARDGRRAHHFYKGKMDCAIEDALEADKRDQAQVHDNLYVALESASSDSSLPRMLPKRFSQLVPLMKASDYDYIIFDMPPVSEISITPRLARFMDLVLVVVESGKTSRDAASRVTAHLTQSQAHVGLVLNKNRSYLPKRLDNPI